MTQQVETTGSRRIAAVSALYAAFGRGDIPAILEGLAEDVTWTTHGPVGTLPVFGARHGRQGVAEFFQAVASEADFRQFEPRDFTSNDTMVIVRVRIGATIKQSGRQLDYDTIHVWDFAGDKAKTFDEYFDTASYLAAYKA